MPTDPRAHDDRNALTVFAEMLSGSHLLAAHDLPGFVARHGAALGFDDLRLYVSDLQQQVLLPFVPAVGPANNEAPSVVGIESTLAGRAFQLLQTLFQEDAGGELTVWAPVVDGTERLGVVALTTTDRNAVDPTTETGQRLQMLVSIVGQLLMTKTAYGDSIVRLRRSAPMGLAAEIQWALLPPLTFANDDVSIAAVLEPAYDVAGDAVDYAVDHDAARFGIFDGMGHGLRSSQLVGVVVNAYRNSRRLGHTLDETYEHVEGAVSALFGGDIAYITGLIGELDTSSGIFSWITAGHPRPLLLRHGRLIKELEIKPRIPFGLGLDASHFVHGAPPAEISIGSEHLEPGDYLLLYTDGVTEARSPGGELFGIERLTDLLIRNLAAGLPVSETMRRAVSALLKHQGSALADDASMLLAQWRPEHPGGIG